MRSNGIAAAAYTPVADLATAEASIQLSRLADAGIGAWCEPLGSGRERLHVDRLAADAVHAEIATESPDAVGGDDLTWARIVAGYDTDATEPVGPWSVREDDDGVPAATVDLHDDPSDVFDPDWSAPLDLDDLDPEDRYVPPEPEPLPTLDAARTAAWTAVVTGPVLLLLAAFAPVALPRWLAWLAVAAFVGGFATLVWHMRTSDEVPDDPDDGAVV